MQPPDLSFFQEQYHCALQYDHSSALDSAAAANALFLLNSHIVLRYMAWCLCLHFNTNCKVITTRSTLPLRHSSMPSPFNEGNVLGDATVTTYNAVRRHPYSL